MVKISRANDAKGSANTTTSNHDRKKVRAQMASLLEGVDLEDVIIFMEFQFKSSFAGFGGISADQLVRVKVPNFLDFVGKKGHDWSRSKMRCEVPHANIFVIVPSKKSNATDLPIGFKVRKIYGGKPEWSKNCSYDLEEYGDAAGLFVASLFGKNYLTAAYGSKCIVVYHYEDCKGAYSDCHKEYKAEFWSEDEDDCDDYEAMLTRLRSEDLKDFLLGSGDKYTTD